MEHIHTHFARYILKFAMHIILKFLIYVLVEQSAFLNIVNVQGSWVFTNPVTYIQLQLIGS